MSIDATRFVWKLNKSQVTPTEKLVLLSYADRADEEGRAYPSSKRLESDTLLDRKTIFKCLLSIQDKGLLTKTGERKGRSNQVHVYKFPDFIHREYEFTSLPKSINGESFTSPKNGTGKLSTSTKNGMGTSTVFGIRNLSLNLKENTTTQEASKITEKVVQEEPQESSSISFEEVLEDIISKQIKKYRTEEKDIPRLREKIRKMMTENLKNGYELYSTIAYFDKIIANGGIRLDENKAPVKHPVLVVLEERDKKEKERMDYEANKDFKKAEYHIGNIHSILDKGA